MSELRGWRGAPEDPPRTAPHVRTELVDGGRLRLVEDDDAWISAAATVALEDWR